MRDIGIGLYGPLTNLVARATRRGRQAAAGRVAGKQRGEVVG